MQIKYIINDRLYMQVYMSYKKCMDMVDRYIQRKLQVTTRRRYGY